jgi:hypothetical protein
LDVRKAKGLAYPNMLGKGIVIVVVEKEKGYHLEKVKKTR